MRTRLSLVHFVPFSKMEAHAGKNISRSGEDIFSK